jgi:hypothetical protein
MKAGPGKTIMAMPINNTVNPAIATNNLRIKVSLRAGFILPNIVSSVSDDRIVTNPTWLQPPLKQEVAAPRHVVTYQYG